MVRYGAAIRVLKKARRFIARDLETLLESVSLDGRIDQRSRPAVKRYVRMITELEDVIAGRAPR